MVIPLSAGNTQPMKLLHFKAAQKTSMKRLCLHLKGTGEGFSPQCLSALSQRSGPVLVLLCCHIKGKGCEFKSFHRRLPGRREHVAPRYLGQIRAASRWHGNKTYY